MAKLLDKAVDKLITSMTFEEFLNKVLYCGVLVAIGYVIYYYANGLHLIG